MQVPVADWAVVVETSLDHRLHLGCGQREADIGVVDRGAEHHAEHRAVLVEQRPAGIPGPDLAHARVDVPGHRAVE